MAVVFLHALPFGGAMWSSIADDDALCPDLYRLGDTVDAWAEAVLDLAPSGPLTVVGNSVGGSCAIEVALRAPERIERLVLIGTKAGHRPEPCLRDEALRVLLEEGLEVAWQRYWQPLFGPSTDPAVLDTARRIAFEQGADAVARGVRAFHSRTDRANWITDFAGPVVVIEGEFDQPARGAALARSVPDGRFHLVPGVGHYVAFEAPTKLTAIIGA